ncbi:DUF4435 domain-containing protein [Stenotrophomonas maltophilia]|uniref:DUF4435 domain-containing protein n=1 Tax=Stenotrophomonas maltophilia TaxID=40324 RepID=UPI001559117A|nr:DUF4435 domain-containing protein [Stenotrophomonas maltophilia]MCU1055345.1 DUF4435 domain-containing protein [Stenotrophomonas maltophilia]
MSRLLERMREGRRSPQVLKIKLISIRSSHPGKIIFFFEGLDDLPVYEEWLARTPSRLEYEAVAGSGKEQLLSFQFALEQDQQLSGVYFFVDHDYDENPKLTNVYVLDAYSIENLLCNFSAIESLLSDELRCAGDPVTRESLLNAFRTFVESFSQASYSIHEILYYARREGVRVERRPEHAREFSEVAKNGVMHTYSSVDEVVQLAAKANPERLAQRKLEFSKLPLRYAVRGKYLMQALRMWVKALADDRRSARPTCFPESMPRLPGCPEQFSLRRLASRTPLPEGLAEFAASIDRGPLTQQHAQCSG